MLSEKVNESLQHLLDYLYERADYYVTMDSKLYYWYLDG